MHITTTNGDVAVYQLIIFFRVKFIQLRTIMLKRLKSKCGSLDFLCLDGNLFSIQHNYILCQNMIVLNFLTEVLN